MELLILSGLSVALFLIVLVLSYNWDKTGGRSILVRVSAIILAVFIRRHLEINIFTFWIVFYLCVIVLHYYLKGTKKTAG